VHELVVINLRLLINAVKGAIFIVEGLTVMSVIELNDDLLGIIW
jgi:hypothetical protein